MHFNRDALKGKTRAAGQCPDNVTSNQPVMNDAKRLLMYLTKHDGHPLQSGPLPGIGTSRLDLA